MSATKASNNRLAKARLPSMEVADPVLKKRQDMLTKARNKLFNLSETLNHNKKQVQPQSPIEYFFKTHHGIYENKNKKKVPLEKQNSLPHPVRIEITEDFDEKMLEKNCLSAEQIVEERRETAALALERPRKKLSFREPEIVGKNELELKRSTSFCNGILHTTRNSDEDLESQALRVVRTIGQAFEVCHKLSINAPENERQQDQDEQDTLTQDLVSDRLSDITSDKHKKDYLSEVASDKMSLPPDDYNIRDIYNEPKVSKPKLDVLAPPPTSNTNRKTPLTTAETYSAPHSDNLTSMNGSGSSLPPPGGALSAHHELQLMREQLEQQNQQTQAAMAQLQLAREQLAAEQSARLEAQSRTHQLLVHNRELLDHIAALVAHLQGSEKSGQQQNAPHMTMPQQNCEDSYLNDLPLDNGPLFHSLIENRAVTSPLRASYPGGNIFNFAYPPPLDPVSPTFDPQLFYSPYFNYNAHLLPNLYASPYATLQRPPKKLVGVSRISPTRSEPYQSQTALYPLQMQQGVNNPVQANQERRSGDVGAQYLQRGSQETGAQYNQRNSQETGAQYNQRSSQETGAQYNQRNSQDTQYNQRSSQERLQHSQRGCQDSDRSRMMNSTDGTGRMMGNLRIGDDLRVPNGAPITRSTSEKVPNRSELMSQVQRTLWARHTTK